MPKKSNIERYNETLTKAQLTARATMAGIASGEARAKRREIKSSLETVLSLALKSGKIVEVEEVQSLAELKNKNISVMDAAAIATIQRWLKGDIRAGELVLDIIGQKPSNKVEVNGSVNNPFAGLSTEDLKKLIGDE